MLITGFTNCNAHNMPPIKEKLIPFQNKDKKWGYLDALTHHIVIQPKYDKAELFENGIACIANFNTGKVNYYSDDFLYGYIDSNGRELFLPVYTGKYEVKTKSGKLLKDLISFNKNGQNGIAKKNGEWLFPLGMHNEFDFYDLNYVLCDKSDFYANGIKYQAPKGYIIFDVDIKNHFFYIRKGISRGVCAWTGEIIIPAKNKEEIRYNELYKRFLADNYFLLAGKQDIEEMSRLMEDAEKKGLDRIETILFDKTGRKLGSYKSIYGAHTEDSILRITSKGKEKNISIITGKEILGSPVNDTTQILYSIFIKDEKYGLTNVKGDTIIAAVYSNLSRLSIFDGKSVSVNHKLYIAAKDGRYGLIDERGRIIIDFKYDHLSYFNVDNQAEVSLFSDNTYKKGVIDINGKEIISLEYQTIFNTKELGQTKETYYQVEKDDKWGLMDKQGKLIIPLQYGYVSVDSADIDKGWIKVEDEQRTQNGAINILTHKSIPMLYRFLTFHDDLIEATTYQDGKYSVQLLNQDGKPASSEIYQSLDYVNSYFVAQKDNKYGLLDKKGKEVLPFKYDYLSFKSPDLLFARTSTMELYADINGTEYLPK